MDDLDTIDLSLEELEALHLSDYEGLEQEEAALRMSVSRRTFVRDLSSGRRKIVDALLNGKAIRICGRSK